MQCLLRERVPVRDLEAVLESVADASRRTRDPWSLAESARSALRRTICQQYARPDVDGRPVLSCVAAGPRLDAAVAGAVRETDGEPAIAMAASDAARVVRAVAAAARPLAESGLPVVVLASRGARAALARLLAPHIPGSAVLAYDELVRGIDVERVGDAELIDGSAEAAA
jgi:flagellar biosynthesis protein FlhA